MSAFTKLPTLERLQSLGGHEPLLRRTCLVCVQHLLETTGSLFEALIESGLPAHRIHVLGKVYSSNDRVARTLREIGVHVYETSASFPWGGYDEQIKTDAIAMWRSVANSIRPSEIDRVVVLDDGAHATTAAPSDLRDRIPMIAVEQTMSGLYGVEDDALPMPVIAVASSAAKKLIEPPMICKAAFTRAVRHRGEFDGLSMGIIGAGSIGRAILRGAVEAGQAANIFDPHESANRDPNVRVCTTAEELLQVSDVLWGCSGTDFFTGLDLQAVAGSAKTLISCSSSDREFRTLLRYLNSLSGFDSVSRLSNVEFECEGVSLCVRRGGFPVNFDGSPESVPAADIQVTRGLLFAGVLQACLQAPETTTLMLCPEAQKVVVKEWFSGLADPAERCGDELVDAFADEEWIAQHSGGNRLLVAS